MNIICLSSMKLNSERAISVFERIYNTFQSNKERMDAMIPAFFKNTMKGITPIFAFMTFASHKAECIDMFLDCLKAWPFYQEVPSLKDICRGSILKSNLWSSSDLQLLLPTELKNYCLYQVQYLLTLFSTILER